MKGERRGPCSDAHLLDSNNSALLQQKGASQTSTDGLLLPPDIQSREDTHVLPVTGTSDSTKAAGVSRDIRKLQAFMSENVISLASGGAGLKLTMPGIDEEFLCGWGAAFINTTATFPINKAIFRQQLHGIGGFKALQQLKKEGLQTLYRGLLPPLLQKTTSVSIMFGFYHKFQQDMDVFFPAFPRPVNHAVAAMLAGTLEMSLTPFERIQSLLQNRLHQQRFKNTFHAARELWAYGFREYYRGVTCIFLRNGPSNVFFFLGREYLGDITPNIEHAPSRFAKDFLCGACLGAVISTIFFPLNVVKTRMQADIGGPFHSVWETFRVVWAERNRKLSNLFKGFHLNYTRSFVSWGIINASYEVLLHFFQTFKAAGDGSL